MTNDAVRAEPEYGVFGPITPAGRRFLKTTSSSDWACRWVPPGGQIMARTVTYTEWEVWADCADDAAPGERIPL